MSHGERERSDGWHPLHEASRSVHLGRLRKKKRRQARAAALAEQLQEAKDLTTDAEALGKLYHPVFGNYSLVALVGLIGALVLAILVAYLLHRGSVDLVLRGKTRSLNTHLASTGRALDLQLAGTRVQLSPVVTGQSQNFPELGSKPPQGTGDPGPATLRVGIPPSSAGRARPSLLVPLAPGVKLGVSTQRDELSVAIFGDRVRGSIDVPLGARIDWELRSASGDTRTERNADVVDFEALARPTLPLVVSVRDPDAWELLADVERELTFAKVTGASNPIVEISSGLESATIQFLEPEKTLSIPKGDFVRLGMQMPGRLLLRRASGSDVLEFEFEGVVSELWSGRELRLEDRRPRLLTWAVENPTLKAVLGIVVFVGTLLWGLFKMKEG
jgi:hypothetical protein